MATGVIKLEDDTTSIEVIAKLPKVFLGLFLQYEVGGLVLLALLLLLTRASFSMCSVHDTKINTSNASSHACK